MGEIDTKSIESVQAALSFFGEKFDQRKSRSTGCDELEKERELERILTDMANFKVQLEAKDSAHKQALLDLHQYQKTAEELSILLKISEFERDIYINDCREARMHVDELESKMRDMTNQLSETVKIQEQLSYVTSELKSTQGKLLSMETELAVTREAKLEAMKQAELMETSLNFEKVKIEDFLRHVSELNDNILHLKLDAIEAEKEKCVALSEKEADLELARGTINEAREELECMRNQLEMILSLESQLLDKSLFIDTLKVELQLAHELQNSAEKAASDASNEINMLKADLELQERESSDQVSYIGSLEIELNQLKLEFKNANDEVYRLNCEVEKITGELEKTKSEVDEIQARENEAQVEIAFLKSDLHKGRSVTAAAEAAEERAKSEKSALYLALQQLALEADEAKKENRRLKEKAGRVAKKTEHFVLVDLQHENSTNDEEIQQIVELKTEAEERGDDKDITISMEEYEALVKKAEKAGKFLEPVAENRDELEILKTELEIAATKIKDFRTRAEQAVSRAEVAEQEKAVLEEQVRKWRERKERRRAALEALWEESISRESHSFKYDEASKSYPPLGKVLNMKF